MLTVVGTAVGGLIGWSDAPAPSADPASLRHLFEDLGLPPGSSNAELGEAIRLFQSRVGLTADGVAGPGTVHLLARYAKEARELRRLDPGRLDPGRLDPAA
jgi:peptidoglycan hydrolase-like protein with peptidoglycan-binding domain